MKYSDYELVYMVKEDENALDYLVKKYEPLYLKISSSFFYKYKDKGIDLDDLLQICRITAWSVIKKFDQDREVLFYSFLIICLKRAIKKYIYLNTKKAIDNYNVSTFEVRSSCLLSVDVYEKYLEYDLQEKIILFKNELKILDAMVFELRCNGFTYKEIALLLEIKEKQVDNILVKVRKKLEKNFLFSINY